MVSSIQRLTQTQIPEQAQPKEKTNIETRKQRTQTNWNT
jgi:hypothetical protein